MALIFQAVAVAKATVAVSLVLNVLSVLNVLLILVLFFVISRNIVRFYLERKSNRPGFKLRSKMVLALMPITLFPAVILFMIASRLPEQILSGLTIDANMATLIEQSQDLSLSYLADVEQLHIANGPEALRVWRSDPDQLQVFLERHHLQAVEVVGSDQQDWVFSASLEPVLRRRIEQLKPFTGSETESVLFDDGIGVWRFPYQSDAVQLNFTYAKDTYHTERLGFVSESFAALNLMQRKRQTISGLYQSTLLIVTLSVIFGGVWMGLRFARTFLGAFGKLAQGAEQVGQGNFDTVIDLHTGDEIDNVVQAFNTMTLTLKTHQEELRQRAEDLNRVNERLSNQMEYTQTLLREVNTGIISTNTHGRVRTVNPAAACLLEISAEESLDADLTDVLAPDRHGQILRHWQQFMQRPESPFSVQIEMGDHALSINLSFLPLAEGETTFGYMMVLEDLTSVLTAQKLAAWREVARRVAHEIKNPLTPIQLSAQRIKRKAENVDGDLADAVRSAHETIMSEIAILKNLVNDFSTYARLPSPAKEPFDVRALMENVRESYAPVYANLRFETQLPSSPLIFNGDPGQIRQVLTNLINNAAQASPKGGTIGMTLTGNETSIEFSIVDQGAGVKTSDRENVFVPYYSRSPKGTGLGLAIVRRIVEDHEGVIRVTDNHPSGAVFTVTLPMIHPSREVKAQSQPTGEHKL